MTSIEAAVTSTLDALDDDEDGFFLMYEEAYIDKHCHSNNLPKTFYALLRFNQVIALFMEYAFYNPNTFILITADHETGGLTDSFEYTKGDHSSADVPVFAYGDGSELFGGQTVENIQIPQTIAAFMGVDNFGDQTTFKPLKKD
jgi:alkaline phosphatase